MATDITAQPLSPAGSHLAGILVESMDALLQETVEALEGDDRAALALLQTRTGGHGPAMAALRSGYLEADRGIPVAERARLLSVLGSAETFFWSLNRLVSLKA